MPVALRQLVGKSLFDAQHWDVTTSPPEAVHEAVRSTMRFVEVAVTPPTVLVPLDAVVPPVVSVAPPTVLVPPDVVVPPVVSVAPEPVLRSSLQADVSARPNTISEQRK